MRRIIAFLLMIICLVSLCACSKDKVANTVFSPEDLPGKMAGVLENTPAYCNRENFEDNGMSIRSYTDSQLILDALVSGTLDCAIMDDYAAESLITRFSKVEILEEPAVSENYSIITAPESAALLSVIDRAMDALILDGTITSIVDSYISGTDYTYTSPADIHYDNSITLAVNTIGVPFAYHNEYGEIVGMDIDIARAVCDYMGVGLTIRDAGGDNLYSFIRRGSADFAMGQLVKTDETQDLVGFSQSYYTCTQVIIVRK